MEYDKKLVERQIKEISSKHTLPILQIIEQDDGIRHGELAERLNLLPSGLSTVVKKMENCALPLLAVSQIGKYRRYSLPGYVKQYLTEKEVEKNEEFLRKTKGKNLFLLLQHFVEAAGDDWRDTMNILLQEVEIDSSVQVGKYLVEFMEEMQKKKDVQEDEVKAVFRFIKNEVLIFLIEEYIEAHS